MPAKPPSVCQTPADGLPIGDPGILSPYREEAIDPGVETRGAIPCGNRVLVVDDDIEIRWKPASVR